MNSNSGLIIQEVLSRYPIPGTITSIKSIKTGLIHHSYKISTEDRTYLLQKINTDIFSDVDSLMNNIALVTNKLADAFQESAYETLEILETNEGKLYCRAESSAWRIYSYKSHLSAYESPKNKEMVWEAGHAFAYFAGALTSTDPRQLSITIPDFHSLTLRYQQLEEALEITEKSFSQIHELVKQISEFTRLLLPLEQAQKDGIIPLRITHNDSKFNNLLFDHTGKARCVVDLDTVMPGIIHFDVGDCLRTLTPNAPEDEPNLKKIRLQKIYHAAFLEGYQSGGVEWLTKDEIEYLPYAAPYISLIMGIRFLTDYLNGNKYYSIDHPKHNLIRCRCQIEVTRQFLDEFPLPKVS